MKNPNGLHVRPASRLVSTLSGFRADMLLEKNGKCVTPDSLNQIALLQVRCNDTLRLIAKGEQADEALAAFKQLATENFGESVEETPASSTARQLPAQVSGVVFCYSPLHRTSRIRRPSICRKSSSACKRRFVRRWTISTR